MASFVGLHNKVYVAHLDFTGHTKTVNFGDLTRQMQDSTTFADGGYTCVLPGLISGMANLNGFQDYSVDALSDDLDAPGQLGAQYPITVFPNPTGTVTVGDAAWMSRGVISKINPLEGAKGDMAGFTLEASYDTAIVQAKVAHTTAVTTSGSDSVVALAGPSASQKLYAALHVTAYSGLTSADIVVESDSASSMASPTTRISFASVTDRTYEWASVAGDFSSETHHRVKYTLTGSGSITFAVAIGVI